MSTLTSVPDIMTADEAAKQISLLAPTFGINSNLPDVRTLRLWRSQKQLTVSGRRFIRRNVLEALVVLKLRQDGLTHQNAVQRTLVLDEERLSLILADVPRVPSAESHVEPLITLRLLAMGVLEQYSLSRDGAVVGHTEPDNTGRKNMPTRLHQAMTRLSRHYFEDEREDIASSVHQLLDLSTHPLAEWAPHAIADLEHYRGAVLIDPVYRVPSEDCEIIAEEAEGANLDNLIERHLHATLVTTLQKLGSDADAAYTIIREFIGRHPMATSEELRQLYLNPELNNDAIDFVRGLYSPVHASKVRGKLVPRCDHCHSLMDIDGYCTLTGCRDDAAPASKEKIPLEQVYVARPDVCKYWADPAREELRLYDTLRNIRRLRDRVRLYPHSDRCDVAVDDLIGIDVKDYRDPVRLAQRLNRSIGQLDYYPERILAIARRRLKLPFYKDRLLEHLSLTRQSQLKVMSVDEAIVYVKANHGGRHNAESA